MADMSDPSGDPERKRIIRAWCLYDWANSAFATTVMSALFPIFYSGLVVDALLPEGITRDQLPAEELQALKTTATAYWAYTTAIAMLLVAVIGPVLGTISDFRGGKKRLVAIFAGMGILASMFFVVIGEGMFMLASGLFIIGNVGFAGSIIFYDSLLPHITNAKNVDRVSALGYAVGYIGGGLLLSLNALWFGYHDWFDVPAAWFGIDSKLFAVKASFVSVGLWWLVFMIPLMRRVPEPAVDDPGPTQGSMLLHGFRRLATTFREIRRYKHLLLFLLAFWVYSDGIGTIGKMAVVYGKELGIGPTHMIIALVITQFVGIPCAIAFGRMAGGVGIKPCILAGLAVYACISVGGYFMKTTPHFYLLAGAVGLVQGGTQALSRSLFSSMIPKGKSAEFFSFFSISEKFAGILGPLVFAVVSQLAGGSRLGILSIIFFFIVGALLLLFVDPEEGRRAARAPEAGGKDEPDTAPEESDTADG